jgi:hypothetical protein
MNIKRKIVAIAGACVMSVGLLSGVAQAATGHSLGVPFTYQGVRGLSVLPVTFTAGDCRQTGLNQTPNLPASAIQVSPPEFDQAMVEWRPTLYTVSSHFGDTWHGRFIFRDGAGGTVLNVTMDGPTMFSKNIYTERNHVRVFLNEAQWNSIVFVDWIGDC